jgi:hypothetical protein
MLPCNALLLFLSIQVPVALVFTGKSANKLIRLESSAQASLDIVVTSFGELGCAIITVAVAEQIWFSLTGKEAVKVYVPAGKLEFPTISFSSFVITTVEPAVFVTRI